MGAAEAEAAEAGPADVVMDPEAGEGETGKSVGRSGARSASRRGSSASRSAESNASRMAGRIRGEEVPASL